MTSRKPLSPHVFTPKWIFIAVLFSIVAIESRSQQKKTNQRTLGSITLNVQVSQPSCGYANGIIMVSASGGTLPYKYTLNGFTQNNGFFPEQTAYTYTLVVTDAAGQSTSQQVTLANTLPAPSLGVNVLKLPSTCTSFDGEVVLSASGGVPPYQYGNNNLAFSSNDTFKNLLEGEYIFFVRDANGCVAEKYFGFLNEFQCTSCCNMHINGYGGLSACKNDGFLDITGYGGTPPYTFSIDGINYFLQAYAGVSQQFSNLIARNYTLYMKDANGIIVMADYPLIEFCSLGISWVEVDASCKGSNGQLTIHATNGTLPYSFTMDGINFQADSLFTGLSAGVYAIAARDAHGILVSAIATVTDSCPTVTAIATNATCGQKNGSISAMGNKGTTPYQFSIDGVNFFASNVFSGLASGTYTVTIKDADGNTSKTSITVGNSCLQVTATTVASTCGNANGTIQASASNGLTPYEYSIDGVNFQASNIFQNLAPGNYTITVMDATGATGSTTIALAGSIGPLISLTLQAASCLSNDGTVTITGSGGTAPYLYSIDGINFLGSNVFSGIAAGATLNTQIKDSNGCIATEGATMTQDCPILNVTSKNETCASKNGSLTLNGSNGVGP
ncbi:MAG TPA: hypothetical protein VKR32_15250, partial [Puia sp.]|nr:hypothetical protein [Puia sp.]